MDDATTPEAADVADRCSFCGKLRDEVDCFIAGSAVVGPVGICSECVELCVQIVDEQRAQDEA